MSSIENFGNLGKVALVTGAAGLLGKRHCKALMETGAKVYLSDLDLEVATSAANELRDSGIDGDVRPLVLNVTDKRSIEEALQEVIQESGRLDILVNNAAIDPKVKSGVLNKELSRFENLGVDDWDFQLDVGLKGAFLCSQVFGHRMATHDGGIILNISSDLSVIAPDQRIYRKDGLPEELQPVKPVTYSVIKSGLIGLTKYLASYWANKRVRVNAISPGGVFNGQPPEFVDKLSNLIPMGRMANLDEYESAIQFLCSDASSYMTGQNIVIDGGRSII